MSSTSCITGTGFMKCIPITASGRLVAAAMRVMGIDEVLVASTPPGRTTASSSWKMRFFSSSFSVTASMATSTSFDLAGRGGERESLQRRGLGFASSSLPFSTQLPEAAPDALAALVHGLARHVDQRDPQPRGERDLGDARPHLPCAHHQHVFVGHDAGGLYCPCSGAVNGWPSGTAGSSGTWTTVSLPRERVCSPCRDVPSPIRAKVKIRY